MKTRKLFTRYDLINRRGYIFVIVACLVGILLSRLTLASVFPAALTHDELVYAAQSKAMALTGKTIDQTYAPWSLQPLHPMYAELPGVFMIPFFGLIENPLLATRGLSLVLGILFPFVLSWFFYEWYKNRKLANCVLVVASFNPLLWQLSRLMYDAVFSVFFYLLAGSLFLRTKTWRGISLSFILISVGFFGYQGYKLLFLPWLFLLLWHKATSQEGQKIKRQIKAFLLLSLALFVAYLSFLLPNQSVADRFSQSIFKDTEFLSEQTNNERRLSLDNPFASLFSNKVIITVKFITEKFIGAFNSLMMFWSGEPAQSKFAVWGHGWFYAIDFGLLLLGLFFMGRHKEHFHKHISIIGFIFIAAIPSTINAGGSWYLLRMFFAYTLLIGFIAWGVYWLLESKITKIVLFLCYGFSILYFGYQYFYRYPILGLNISYFSERVVINYIDRIRSIDPLVPIYVHAVDVPVMLWNYIVYSDYYSKKTSSEFAQQLSDHTSSINNIIFTTECANPSKDAIVINESWRGVCEGHENSEVLTIPSVVDNGAYWHIYNDAFCNDVQLKPFIELSNHQDMLVEKKSQIEFCQNYFAKFK